MFQHQKYACLPEKSRGRLYNEPEARSRSCFQRDRDRIIHTGAFRRLQYKTQVFVNHEGDYFRTRLTHSLEVAQIARSISRALGVNEDLAEALALAHDLGHTPFGHAGEHALAEVMQPFGGFDHNIQAFRILVELSRRYPDYEGLNLTWETLEGAVKHNGPLAGKGKKVTSKKLKDFNKTFDLELKTWPSLEAQIAALSDDIAYNSHDIEDGVSAGLFQLDQLQALPVVGEAIEKARAATDVPKMQVHETIRNLIGRMVADLIDTTRTNLGALAPDSVEDIRKAGAPTAAFSEEMQAADTEIKAFLRENMYTHYRVKRMTSKAKRVVQDLFQLFMAEPDLLPEKWQARRAVHSEKALQAGVVADYIAGMTDRFAMQEHQQLFDLNVRTGLMSGVHTGQ